MEYTIINPSEKLKKHVKTIYVMEKACGDDTTISLPFFADGYPGIVFYSSNHDIYQLPKNKKLSRLFLYGQTIHPMELLIRGSYSIIVFQLFPYAAKNLTGINPIKLNDDCFDLSLMPNQNIESILKKLSKTSSSSRQIQIISEFIEKLIVDNPIKLDNTIQMAINQMINSKGKITIKKIREQLHCTERTFERQFLSQVGLTPKQFAKIIQFQSSFNQLNEHDYSLLTDIVFDNGYADQSHFIKNFKKFTGKTPSKFQKE